LPVKKRDRVTGRVKKVYEYRVLGYRVGCSFCNTRIERPAVGKANPQKLRKQTIEVWNTRPEVGLIPNAEGLYACPLCGSSDIQIRAIAETTPWVRTPFIADTVTCAACGLMTLPRAPGGEELMQEDFLQAWNARQTKADWELLWEASEPARKADYEQWRVAALSEFRRLFQQDTDSEFT